MLPSPLLVLLVALAVASCDGNAPPEVDPEKDARLFEQGELAQQAGNHAEAYWHWRTLADRGHADAQYRIGWMYANGHGLVLDVPTALQWWRKAAEQKHADATFALAMVYFRGEGVKRDPAAAVKWLTRSRLLGGEDAAPMLLSMAGVGHDRAEREVKALLKGKHWRDWGGVWRVKADRANVRAGPAIDRELVTSLEQGAEVIALHFEDDWVRVGIPGSGELAWIYRPLLEQAEEPETEEESAETDAATPPTR
jgi:hypothetical protein